MQKPTLKNKGELKGKKIKGPLFLDFMIALKGKPNLKSKSKSWHDKGMVEAIKTFKQSKAEKEKEKTKR